MEAINHHIKEAKERKGCFPLNKITGTFGHSCDLQKKKREKKAGGEKE